MYQSMKTISIDISNLEIKEIKIFNSSDRLKFVAECHCNEKHGNKYVTMTNRPSLERRWDP